MWEPIHRRGPASYLTVSLAHYYEQDGDLCPDPDMEIRVWPNSGMVEAVTLQDSFGYRQVYPGPGFVALRPRRELNSFLATWRKNIKIQGHKRVERVVT